MGDGTLSPSFIANSSHKTIMTFNFVSRFGSICGQIGVSYSNEGKYDILLPNPVAENSSDFYSRRNTKPGEGHVENTRPGEGHVKSYLGNWKIQSAVLGH